MNSALAIQRRRGERIVNRLVERAPRGALHCVFAGGSLGRGEVWAARAGDILEIYSDVDLYVVVAAGADRASVVRAARDAAAAEEPDESGAVFLRAVDVGVYTEDDLLGQPVRPGTADLARHHVWLHGDRSILGALAHALSAPMDALEALYLLENRALELAAAGGAGGGPARRLDCVTALKARLDVGAAHAIVQGRFAPTLRERERCFELEPPPLLSGPARAAVAAAYARSHDLEAWLRVCDAAAEHEASMQLAAQAWRVLAASLFGGREDLPRELVSRRCHEGRRLANAHELVRLRRAFGLRMTAALVIGARYSRFSPSPALRLHTMVEEWSRERPSWASPLGDLRRYVDGLTQALGHTQGSLEQRVAAACRAIR